MWAEFERENTFLGGVFFLYLGDFRSFFLPYTTTHFSDWLSCYLLIRILVRICTSTYFSWIDIFLEMVRLVVSNKCLVKTHDCSRTTPIKLLEWMLRHLIDSCFSTLIFGLDAHFHIGCHGPDHPSATHTHFCLPLFLINKAKHSGPMYLYHYLICGYKLCISEAYYLFF